MRSSKWWTLSLKFFKRPGKDRRLLVEAACLLSLARLAILLVPFRRMTPFLGCMMTESSRNAQEHAATAREVSRAVQTAARHLPWECTCLAQAVSAKAMLKRRKIPSTLYLGLAKNENESMAAHAWLRCGEIVLTGKPGMERFTVISNFAEKE